MWNNILKRLLPRSAVEKITFLESRHDTEAVFDLDTLPKGEFRWSYLALPHTISRPPLPQGAPSPSISRCIMQSQVRRSRGDRAHPSFLLCATTGARFMHALPAVSKHRNWGRRPGCARITRRSTMTGPLMDYN